MSSRTPRTVTLTGLAMIAFAANSILCRLALKRPSIDPASFVAIRVVSGAIALWLIVRWRGGSGDIAGSWRSALALFAYAAAFSYAYVSLSASTGALLLFAAVQSTMIGYGIAKGERLGLSRWMGLILAFAGLVGLVLPGLSAPPPLGSAMMLLSGIAWGVYSLRGRSNIDPIRDTAGNFLRAAPMAVLLSAIAYRSIAISPAGAVYAAASGALTSGVGYVIWYAALRDLTAATAATVQLSVPVLAACGGVVLLGEAVSPRLVVASAAILGGIAWFLTARRSPAAKAR